MKKLLIVLSLLANVTVQAYAEFAIIVHPHSKLDHISNRQLAQIFLSKTKHMPSGEPVRPVELASTQSKSLFYNKVANKREVELRKYWAKMIFTGNGQPPKQFSSIENILEYVASKPGAIAYIPKESVNASVKILKYLE